MSDAPLSKLSIYTLHAPHDCHALREHDGAHDLSGPMPFGALSAESCVVFAATHQHLKSPRGTLIRQPKSLNTSPRSFRRAHTPCLTRLPRPEIALWSTQSNCSDGNRCPRCREMKCGAVLNLLSVDAARSKTCAIAKFPDVVARCACVVCCAVVGLLCLCCLLCGCFLLCVCVARCACCCV